MGFLKTGMFKKLYIVYSKIKFQIKFQTRFKIEFLKNKNFKVKN